MRAATGGMSGSGVAGIRVTLIPREAVVVLVLTSGVAAAANSGFRFLATGRAVDNGVSVNVRQGLSLCSSPREDMMASLFEGPTDGANC